MAETPQPDRAPDDEPPPHPAEPLQINRPVIKQDAWAIDELKEFDRSIERQLPDDAPTHCPR